MVSTPLNFRTHPASPRGRGVQTKLLQHQSNRLPPARLLVTLLLLIAAPASAQFMTPYPDEPTPNLAVRPATLVLTLTNNDLFHDAIFSPDGKSIYTVRSDMAVNLWAMAIYYWPYMLALLVGVLFVRQFIRVVQRWRFRGLDPGEPVCRKCRYQLTGCTSATCPECGNELTESQRLIARPINRYALLHLLILMCLLAAAGALIPFEAVRYGKVSRWLPVESFWLADCMDSWGAQSLSHHAFAYPVLFLEQRAGSDGQVERVLYRERWRSSNTMYAGSAFLVRSSQRGRIILAEQSLNAGWNYDLRTFDATSGKVLWHENFITPWALNSRSLMMGMDDVLYDVGWIDKQIAVINPYALNAQLLQLKRLDGETVARFTFQNQAYEVYHGNIDSKTRLCQVYKTHAPGTNWPLYHAAASPALDFVYLLVSDANSSQNASSKPNLLVKDLKNDRYLARFDAPSDFEHWLRVSPDGRRVLLMHELGKDLMMYDLNDVLGP